MVINVRKELSPPPIKEVWKARNRVSPLFETLVNLVHPIRTSGFFRIFSLASVSSYAIVVMTITGRWYLWMWSLLLYLLKLICMCKINGISSQDSIQKMSNLKVVVNSVSFMIFKSENYIYYSWHCTFYKKKYVEH